MDIKYKAMGDYQTNCYVLSLNDSELIVDPGVDAFSWVKQNVRNPIAILNTHGHFDHIWSNQALKEYFHIPIYCPVDDAFMLSIQQFGVNFPTSKADEIVKRDKLVEIGDFKVKFWHFAGHTPGCSALQIEDCMFSGDFLFKRSIGRVDFPYSNPQDMKKSIQKVLQFKEDLKLYPGHGECSTLFEEQKHLLVWYDYL